VEGGRRANAALVAALDASGLDDRDRAFATELVFGTVRMQRACDWLAEPFVRRALEPEVRAAVRVGVHQIVHLRTPPHAAVSATVDAAPGRARGLVNAVLRRVAERWHDPSAISWPDDATRLSYPDWVLDDVMRTHGRDDGVAALEAMNRPQAAVARPDGYRWGRASEWVAGEVACSDLSVDLCAAPGGKATALRGQVMAVELDPGRARLLAETIGRTDNRGRVHPVVADGAAPPLRQGSAGAVLVDAPCSGLGALGRRPDARWRVRLDDVPRLAALQRRLVEAAIGLLRPDGQLVYSACTITTAETLAIDTWLAERHPRLVPEPLAGAHWRSWGRGGLVLPHDHGTDGMAVFRYRMAA
jgi:16S rRNA (cytosine967-C5)-methyltransferase